MGLGHLDNAVMVDVIGSLPRVKEKAVGNSKKKKPHARKPISSARKNVRTAKVSGRNA
jgi:hypothetical protein